MWRVFPLLFSCFPYECYFLGGQLSMGSGGPFNVMGKRLLYTMFGQLQNALDYITQTKSNFMQFLDSHFPPGSEASGVQRRNCMSAFWSGHAGAAAAAGCCLRMLLSQWCALWGGHANAAAGCCCTVAVQGAAVRVACALWSVHAGAAAGCSCKVLLAGAAVKVVCALQGPEGRLTGAAAGCCCRVLL